MIARDSVNAGGIPPDTAVVLGYGDGTYQWSSEDWARFPHSVELSIVVSAADAGDVLDVERGDAAPADIPGWCDRFDRPGRRAPTVYCDRETWPAARAAAGDRRVDWWIATLDGSLVDGAALVQVLDAGAYDESVILDPTWVGGSYTMVLQPDDLAAIKSLLDAGTAAGQPDWAHTSQATLATVQQLTNQLNAVVSQLASLSGALTASQAQQLADAVAGIARLETALQAAAKPLGGA